MYSVLSIVFCTGFLLYRVEEETQQSFGNDTILLTFGYVLTFLYFAAFLGKFNQRENKVCMQLVRLHLYCSFFQLWVAVLGIMCIGFTLVVTTGLASYMQLPYGPVHSIIPFLLLGYYTLFVNVFV